MRPLYMLGIKICFQELTFESQLKRQADPLKYLDLRDKQYFPFLNLKFCNYINPLLGNRQPVILEDIKI